ncbi:MAG: sugar ABC transporter ATP-binding protein [Lachnospiraceae bacterium]|nr:sugar ABC transporter ATP-binding protein [Lachnospiraceae bacterium]
MKKADDDIILWMKDIEKSFSGVQVLKKVQLMIKAGEVHALVGENGAGKSTLMKILLGIYRKDGGEVIYRGEKMEFHSPADALNRGISMIHQEVCLIPDMTVAENIFLGREDNFSRANVLLDVAKQRKQAKELLERLKLDISIDAKVQELSVAQMQLVELARAVSYDPNIVIMDEPTSALSNTEIEKLFSVIRMLTSQGVSVIFISHKLEEIYEVCDRITVMRDGEYIITSDCSELQEKDLINYIVGRKVDVLYEKEKVEQGEEALRVEGLVRSGTSSEVSFSVKKGEVLGFCGLMGAGRSEILRAVYGIDKKVKGDIYVEGVRQNIYSPKTALKCGIAMVTEDRLRQGVIGALSLVQNVTISMFDRICSGLGFFHPSREKGIFVDIAKKLSIKYAFMDASISNLSGGNQQKAIIGRAMLTNPKVILFDEPTRGIDVGAKAEIYKLIDELAANGLAVVMISSELPELLSLCDRIAVIREGEIVYECEREKATQELLMGYAFGTKG